MLALDRLQRSGKYKIDHLHTVIDEDLRRVGLHGVSERLIDHQAASLGIPLEKLYLTASKGHNNYEKLMSGYFANLESEAIEYVMYGDIFLEDLKIYREQMLVSADLEGIYPLWKEDTKSLIDEFINRGYKTKICAANADFFKERHLGKTIDNAFIKSLPEHVDVCGENGEFHTFVYDGPLFSYPLDVKVKEIVSKDYNYNKKNDDGSIEELKSTFLFAELALS